jgi:hypothetical protein
MKWEQSSSVCLQFWFMNSDKSNSSALEVFFETVTRTVLLWKVADQTSDGWTFGQVEIPENSTGKVSYFELLLHYRFHNNWRSNSFAKYKQLPPGNVYDHFCETEINILI